jgi:hypothetical protein
MKINELRVTEKSHESDNKIEDNKKSNGMLST